MKKLSLILVAVAVVFSLTSCTGDKTNAESDAVAGGASDSVYGGNKVTHTITSVIEEFDYAKEINLGSSAPKVSFTIPEEWKGSGAAYESYDKRISGYTRTFEIYDLFKVDESFIMSDKLISLCRFNKIFSKKLIDALSMSEGETDTGYNYAVFITQTADTYLMIAFVRVAPELILPFSVVLPADGEVTAQRCLNSVVFTDDASLA